MIVLLKTRSRYEVGAHFVEELAAGFRTLGQEVSVYDLLEGGLFPTGGEVDFVFSLNGQSLEFEWDVPQATLYIDDPLQDPLSERLGQKGPLSAIVDAQLIGPVQEHYGCQAIALSHGAHGGWTERERTIPVLFAATYRDPEVLRAAWSPGVRELLDPFVERAALVGGVPLWRQWEGSPLLAPLLLPLAEQYVRHLRRHRLMEAMGEAGIEVTLCGEGWESYRGVDRHRSLGPKRFDEVLELFERSRVVLHANPAFMAGSHERVLNAVARGAAVVADRNPFFESLEIPLFSWGDLGEVAGLVQGQLERPQVPVERVREGHLWRHRAKELLVAMGRG